MPGVAHGSQSITRIKPARILIERDGAWWSFAPPEWLAVAKEAVYGKRRLTLPSANKLKRQPTVVTALANGDALRCTASGDTWVYQPRDWSAEDFAHHARVLGTLINGS